MATNHTSNYQLNQWEPTDQVLRTDFNEDNVKLDSALNGLSTTAKQHGTQISQINQKLPTLGNCQIYQTTYVGNEEKTISFTFPHKPMLIFVIGQTSAATLFAQQGVSVAAGRSSDLHGYNDFSWSGNSVSWTALEAPIYQCNKKGESYLLLALLDMEH